MFCTKKKICVISYLWCKEIDGPVMITYGIKWKCEGPFEATDIERAQIITTGQGVVYWFMTMTSD